MKVRNPKEGLNSFCCQTSFCHPPPEWELSAGIQGWLRLFKVILPHTPHSTNSHAAQRKRRDIHRHAFAGSQSRLCRASVNPGVKPKNKASQSWSGLVKPKTFSEKQPDATHNTHFTSREPFLRHSAPPFAGALVGNQQLTMINCTLTHHAPRATAPYLLFFSNTMMHARRGRVMS